MTQLAEFRAAKALAEKRLARLRELSDTVPRKEVEAAESEVLSLTDRMSAVGGGLSSKEALVAPVSGVIASAHVVAGQVVDTRDLILKLSTRSGCALKPWLLISQWPTTSAVPHWLSATSARHWFSWVQRAVCESKLCR